MTDTKHDEKKDAPPFRSWADPAPVKADEKSPQEKAAETRAKNKRAEERAEKRAAQDAEAAEVPAERRTWSCPACGRGTTMATADGPDGPMVCMGCGVESDTWLPPGVGHGEPELQVRSS